MSFFPKWSGTIIGVLLGVVIGLLTDNVVSFIFLGLMFGLIGDYTVQQKRK